MRIRQCVLPGADLAEGLEGGGGHVAESSIVAQQQEGQHLKSQRHKHKLKIECQTASYHHINQNLQACSSS